MEAPAEDGRGRIAAVVLIIIAVVAVSSILYIEYGTQSTNDNCVGRFIYLVVEDPTATTVTVTNRTEPGSGYDLRFASAALSMNGVRIAELRPLADNGTNGPLTFYDRDQNRFLTAGDRFVARSLSRGTYELSLSYASCSSPAAHARWTV